MLSDNAGPPALSRPTSLRPILHMMVRAPLRSAEGTGHLIAVSCAICAPLLGTCVYND